MKATRPAKFTRWVRVESSVFTSAAYRRGERQLYLRFRNGSIYRYLDCPRRVYEEFIGAESKGAYFGRNIRNVLPYEMVHHPAARNRTQS